MTPTILSLISLLGRRRAGLGAVEWKRGFPVTRRLMASVGINWGGPQYRAGQRCQRLRRGQHGRDRCGACATDGLRRARRQWPGRVHGRHLQDHHACQYPAQPDDRGSAWADLRTAGSDRGLRGVSGQVHTQRDHGAHQGDQYPWVNKVLSNTNYAAGTWSYLDSAAEGGGNIYKFASSTASGGNWILTLIAPCSGFRDQRRHHTDHDADAERPYQRDHVLRNGHGSARHGLRRVCVRLPSRSPIAWATRRY